MLSADTLAFLQYTSGSTAMPKGAVPMQSIIPQQSPTHAPSRPEDGATRFIYDDTDADYHPRTIVTRPAPLFPDGAGYCPESRIPNPQSKI